MEHQRDKAKFELEERLRSEGEYQDTIAELTINLGEARKELETQVGHKEGLRNMLEKEKTQHRITKTGSEKRLKSGMEDAQARAHARVFKMQISQKKALNNLKDMENKYKRVRAQSEDKDNMINDLDERIKTFKDQIVELNQATKMEVASTSNEMNRYKEEVESYKDAIATTKALYVDLQQQHVRVTSDYTKLQEDMAANGDVKELTKEFEAILFERRETYETTLNERDVEIVNLKKTVESNGNNIEILKMMLKKAEDAKNAVLSGVSAAKPSSLHYVDKSEADRLREEIERLNTTMKEKVEYYESEYKELEAERDQVKDLMQGEVEKAREEMKTMVANESYYTDKIKEGEELVAIRNLELQAARSE